MEFEKPNPITFPKSLLEGKEAKVITLQNLPPPGKEIIEANRRIVTKPGLTHLVNYFNIEAKKNCYLGATGNAFFDAFYLAYNLHGELVLSPDDIWLQVTSQIGKYIDDNGEKMRDKIVDFEGKEQLNVLFQCVDRECMNPFSNKFNWRQFLKEIEDKIGKNTKGEFASNFLCNFSTTSPISRISSQVALMQATKKYFNYRIAGKCVCGIQKLYFLGELTDWKQIISKIKYLIDFFQMHNSLQQWLKKLNTTVLKFIEAFENKIDLEFWDNVTKKVNGYASFQTGVYSMKTEYLPADFINGWILDFFLYNGKGKFLELKNTSKEQPYLRDDQIINNIKFEKGILIEEISNSKWEAPIVFENLNNGEKIGLTLISGFSSVLLEHNAYRPQTCFSILKRELKDEENEYSIKKKMFNNLDVD